MQDRTFKKKKKKKLENNDHTPREQLLALYSQNEQRIHAIHKPYNKMAIHPQPRNNKTGNVHIM
jgi:hypothetical protein